MKRQRRKKHHKKIWGGVSVLLLLISFAVILFYMRGQADKKAQAAKAEPHRQAAGSLTEIRIDPYLPDIQGIEVGTVIEPYRINPEQLAGYFTISEIDDNIFSCINGKSYRENEHIRREDLRYLKVLHYNYSHQIQVGEIIVNAKIAEDCKNVFYELFEQQYEIESMYLIDKFWTGDSVDSDTNSIEHNNTSSFNYRVVPGQTRLSNHAAGYAVDINPLQNPYVKYNKNGKLAKYYKDMEQYMDRTSGKPHMITHEDVCYQIFTKYGFTWGGDWNSLKDYQHFEKKMD